MKLELSFSAALLSALLVCSCKSQSAQTDDFDGIIIEAPLLNETPTDKPVFSDYIESIDTIRLDDSVWNWGQSPFPHIKVSDNC